MNKFFRFVSILVVLVMVLGFFAAPMNGASQVSAQKEVPTFVVAPTEVPTSLPGTGELTPVPETTEIVPVEPGTEITPEPTPLPGTGDAPEVVPLIEAAAEVAVPGRYIIVFKDGVDKDAARQAALEKIAAGGGRVAFEYSSAVDGIAAEFSPEVLRKLRQDGRIEYIEQDQKVSVHDEGDLFSIQTVVDATNVWGLDRIDQTSLFLDHKYYYPSSAGLGVNIYIIDTGILSNHQNFGGRVTLDFDAIGGSTAYAADCDGHGTHVAGTAAGGVTGVARKANLHSVRVLDCTGSGLTSQIIAGIDWVAKNHVKPAVANMSLGGGLSPAEDAAVSKAIAKGVTFVVAAGNDDDNACNTSPAHVAGAITVGATDNTDTRASFSNYGKCVDIFAPGVNIYSSIQDSNSSYDGTWDGTSMAAPHVAGLAALYLSFNPTAKPSQVAVYITGNALTGIVIDPGVGSPNRLLHLPNNLTSAPVLVSPINNSVTNDQTPLFRWKMPTNTDLTYLRISAEPGCVDNYNSMILQGTQYEYNPNLPEGDYYWKVAANNTDGSQEVWSTCWKFIVDITGPSAPVQTFPAASAEPVGIPTFTWLPSPTAKTYRFAYDEDGFGYPFDFTSPALTKTQYKPANIPINRDVYWYVQAIDNLGNEGPWSTGRSIIVAPLTPNAPKLIALINNASTKDQTPELEWKTVQYAAFHRVEIDTEPKFLDPLVEYAEASYNDGTYPVSNPLAEGKYYWRVRAKNDNGVEGAWSVIGIFIVDLTRPLPPILKTPAAGAEVVGIPNFTWSVPVSAKTFEFQYDRDPGFPDPYTSGVITKANHKPNFIMPLGTNYWQVRAFDSAGNPSSWSEPRMIYILPAVPAKVTLTSPSSGFYSSAGFINLTWTDLVYANHYELQIDDKSTFSSPDFNDNEIYDNETSADINGLIPGKWYWRIRALNSNDVAGPWSTARYFYKSTSIIRYFNDVSEMSDFTQHPGATWNVAFGGLYNDGIANSFNTSSISYNATLSNFSVNTQVIMDNASSEANIDLYGLVVRGTPTFNSWYDWTKGYYFMVTQDQDDEYNFGCFRVYSLKGDNMTLLSGFCDPAILENTWNMLDVSANGKNFQFRINGNLMWQGTDASYTSGRVGLFNYSYHCDEFGCFETTTHDRFSADYFRIGAPVNITSAEVVQPNPAYGIGPDPFEIRLGE